MCIIFTNITSRPDDETLIRAERRNSDGIGLAWRQDGLVHWEKGMKMEALMTRLHEDPPPFPNIIHFRVATSGGKAPELCHPFSVSAKASTDLKGASKGVLFHNGSWSGWQQEVKQVLLQNRSLTPGGRWSDSRAMAFLANYYGPNIFNLLDMGGQRIALLTADDLLTWGGWEHKEGWNASNPSFQSYGQGNNHNLNVQSDDDWKKNPQRWDQELKKFVPMPTIPMDRRPTEITKGKGMITVMEDGKIVSQEMEDGEIITAGSLAITESPTDSLTRASISKLIFGLHVFARRLGYTPERRMAS